MIFLSKIGTIIRSLGHCPSESQLQEVISEMEDSEQMGYIHMDRFLPVMSRYGQNTDQSHHRSL